MAAAAPEIAEMAYKLPAVLRSPSTIQYKGFSGQKATNSPFFKPRFTFKKEDRQHTLLKWQAIKRTDPLMPPYPHGENKTFPEANFGLYGGATVQSGHKISKGRNKGKTVRHWFPNVRVETVRSEALDIDLKIPITARVMRTITKVGGLDQYVTGSKPARIKELGLLGWKLRWLVMTSRPYQQKYNNQWQDYLSKAGASEGNQLRDLPRHYQPDSTFEDAWNDEAVRTKMIQQQQEAWDVLNTAAQRFEDHVQRQWKFDQEDEKYSLKELKTFKQHSPATLALPERLDRPDEIRNKHGPVLKIQSIAEQARKGLGADRTAELGSGEMTQRLDSTDQKIEDLALGLSMADLGVDLNQDRPEDIQEKIDAARGQIGKQVAQQEEQTLETSSDHDKDDPPEVMLAKTGEEMEAKVDDEFVEKNAEEFLEEVRDEMKEDKDGETSPRSDRMVPPKSER